MGVNTFRPHGSPVGCYYRAELQRRTWGGSPAGGYVVGEVRQDAQQQAPRAAADPSVCGSESGLNNIYKPPHEDSQQSASLQTHTVCLFDTGIPGETKPVVRGVNDLMSDES